MQTPEPELDISAYNLIRYNQKLIIYPYGFLKRGPSSSYSVSKPSDIPLKDIELIPRDKVKIRCSLVLTENPSESRGTIIMFHGNAMDHGDALITAGRNLLKKNFNILSAEYRGYGESEGVPSENGLCLDAQAAVDYVTADPILSELPIIIYGRSLGGAVAIHATCKNVPKISALIIENTFTSVPNLVKDMPVIKWLWFLTTEKWYSESKLSRLPTTLPILMLSGLRDQVIPPKNMERMWKAAQQRGSSKGKKKPDYEPPTQDVFKTFKSGDHNDTVSQPGYWQTLHDFLDNALGNDLSLSVERH